MIRPCYTGPYLFYICYAVLSYYLHPHHRREESHFSLPSPLLPSLLSYPLFSLALSPLLPSLPSYPRFSLALSPLLPPSLLHHLLLYIAHSPRLSLTLSWDRRSGDAIFLICSRLASLKAICPVLLLNCSVVSQSLGVTDGTSFLVCCFHFSACETHITGPECAHHRDKGNTEPS